MVRYIYDAWGNHVVKDGNGAIITDKTHVGQLNPFRYRGYYYDTETGLYYLKTRYYDPETGRFLNMDNVAYVDPATVNGLNLYAYCNNNPVMDKDPNGNFSWKKLWENAVKFSKTVPVFETIVTKMDDVIKNWVDKNLGAGIVKGNNYESISQKTIVGDIEAGVSDSSVIAGDISKPLSVFAQTATEDYRIWEYKVGVQVNQGDGGVQLAVGLLESSVGFSFGDWSFDFICGANKMGFTVNYGKDFNYGRQEVGNYVHGYVRSFWVAAAVLATYLGGVFGLGAVGVAIAAQA